ncbi:MAG: hypothetical protein AAFV74_04880 [Pseudomonadota bacterium]
MIRQAYNNQNGRSLRAISQKTASTNAMTIKLLVQLRAEHERQARFVISGNIGPLGDGDLVGAAREVLREFETGKLQARLSKLKDPVLAQQVDNPMRFLLKSVRRPTAQKEENA